MTDRPAALAERVLELAEKATKVIEGDHARGCDGRGYVCTCGFDLRTFEALRELRIAAPALARQLLAARKALERADHAFDAISDRGHLNAYEVDAWREVCAVLSEIDRPAEQQSEEGK